MNRLLDRGMVQELCCGDNFAYILKDDSLFLPTEYKVLHSQSGGGFVPCMKMRYNGYVQLYYMVSELKPLAAMASRLDTAAFFTVVRNLFADIISARTNGFLSCQNIVLSFDKIFVEPESLKVSLVYLPVSEHVFDDYGACENQLRSDLAQMINSMAFASEGVMRLAMDLSNRSLSLDEIYERLKNDARGKGDAYEKGEKAADKGKKSRENIFGKMDDGTQIISTLGAKRSAPELPSVPPYKPASVPPYKPAPLAPVPPYNPTVPPMAPPVSGGSGPSLTFRPAPDLSPRKKKEGK